MNMLVDGEWRTDAYEANDDDGSFQRQQTTFRDRVRDDPDAEFQPEAGRYHLYVSYACPWAHRTLVTRALKGLEDAISVSVVDPYRGEDGWQFAPEKEGCTRDHVRGADYLRELYVEADPDATCRVTVPVLWDKREDTIVNNESEEIMRMLDTEFDDYATRDVDLYPEGYRDEVDRIIDEIYEPINNGVYRAGFATRQEPYDEAVDNLFAALDHWDEVLADQRYLAGDRLTEADVAMFTTLVRFDNVYHTHFMCNVQYVREYDNLWPYLRDLYQTGVDDRREGTPDGRTGSGARRDPGERLDEANGEERPVSEATRDSGVAETVDMDHIKEHYYTTHPDVNPHRIVARGPDLDFEAPHERDELPGSPPADLAAASADD
ncbi:Glutathione transferase [Haloterrigena turkmenica DSM 5511]|uniref:Glutathione transferase n=1 Tax=Haloterrigena turkmenica (strain ATCC 51198 / DSM 5511 / JCM 9101 / NCIMB 13204 / VKM B-1734 / 4k) TaxID=543526 RepID=D2RV92_HALTV|nr:glutathione S-transferase family protein [Haloterrigena turkmenica]ADB61293.1 Glutathione transferase [Haloterrigena turkmenica DSM 5511]